MVEKFMPKDRLEITVIPTFESDNYLSTGEEYVWTYNIKVKNRDSRPLQIISRMWRIVDSDGNKKEIVGEGVVGRKPIINSGEQFKYSSYAQLRCPSGMMYGSYQVRDIEDGSIFTVTIPAFSLDVPGSNKVLN